MYFTELHEDVTLHKIYSYEDVSSNLSRKYVYTA
jgi:hypothetical protein